MFAEETIVIEVAAAILVVGAVLGWVLAPVLPLVRSGERNREDGAG